MKSTHSRRQFIHQSAIVSLGFLALSRCHKGGADKPALPLSLESDPAGYLDLPQGFQYKVISRAGEPMSDGFFLPGRPDGMGAFAGSDGLVIVVRNHENSPLPQENSGFGTDNALLQKLQSGQLYDYGRGERPALGGTTTFVYNEQSQKIERQFLSLAGTTRNCAGGVTPWNSWLSCEEDVTRQSEWAERDHGFVFEVPAMEAIGIARPEPIKAMGRFNHEAVAVDPRTGIVYQTEDRHDGLIYRFLPNTPGKLQEGGQLQALMVVDRPSLDTRNWDEPNMALNKPVQVHWINIDNVLSPEDTLRQEGFDAGAARFARGEGMWWGDNELYFACTNGGPRKLGQVFRYRPGQDDRDGYLDLFAESENKTVLHACDNLTVAPWGDVILCEDNGELNYIRGINQKGEIYNLACNRSSTSEFAGLTFSPSGQTLFVNIQENGDTLAITGDWKKLA